MKQPAWKCTRCHEWTPHGSYRCMKCNDAQPAHPEFDMKEFGNGPQDKPQLEVVPSPERSAEVAELRQQFAVGGSLQDLYDDVPGEVD